MENAVRRLNLIGDSIASVPFLPERRRNKRSS